MESYNSYKKINNIAGWLVLLFATVVYAMTLESSGSFWDCGEFVPCCWRLQVPHSPGAPLFVMIGRFFTFFAMGDTSRVAIMVNFMSGLSTAFAMMFIYWTTTHLAGKVFFKNKATDYTRANIAMVVGAGVIAAACATFLDSMWFSAVEGEVYALSQFFMGFIVWAIMKWDSIDDKEDKYADRWLILICYMVGLSIGVHLLSLLALPFIALVYYYKRTPKPTVIGFLLANAIGFIILGFAMKFVISYTQSFMGAFDKFFVNSLGMPFWSGAFVYIFLWAAFLIGGIYYTRYLRGKGSWDTIALVVSIIAVVLIVAGTCSGALTIILGLAVGLSIVAIVYYTNPPNKFRYWHLGFLCVTFMYIGYMSYALIPIRASINPPIDMGRPTDPFAIKAYVDREQYGDRPLTWGPNYTATQADMEPSRLVGEKYYKGKTKYEDGGKKYEQVWKDEACMAFPRLGFWQEESKKTGYRFWIQPSTQLIDRKTGQSVQDFDAGQIDRAEQIVEQQNAQEPGRYMLKDKIGQWENLKFFFKYQIGYMYLRYFMWNFAGKQDDIQGRYDNDNGRWICGIPFIDNLGGTFFTPDLPQDHLSPTMAANKGRNKFYMIPLLLGIIGFIYTLYKHDKIFLVVLVLFGVTGVLQLIYQNEPPFEPRERDYALAGSFWAYCIWIGFGIMAIAGFIRSRIKNNDLSIVAGVLVVCASAPYLMGSQGWDDHSRHARYTTRDLARDYLESCAPNALLFTQGDNDTYPLWYAQGVENIRPDVRIINLSLIGVDWYIEQLKYRWNDAPPVKITFKDEQIDGDKREYIRYSDGQHIPAGSYVDLRKVMEFIASEDPDKKVAAGQEGEMVNYLPARNVSIDIDTNKVKAMNMVDPRDMGKVVPQMKWTIANALMKNDLITLDMIANNIMDRPIYFAVSVSPEVFEGLSKYLQLEGMAYRVVPIENSSPNHRSETCPVRTDVCYKNMVEKFRFGGIKENPDIYLDEQVIHMTMNLRGNYARLAEALIAKGEKDKAIKALDKAMLEMPKKAVPYDYYVAMYPNLYYTAGATDKAKKLSDELWAGAKAEVKYYQYAYGIAVQRAKDSGNKLESDELAQGKFLQTNRDLNLDLYILREMAQVARGYEKPAVASAMEKEATDLQYIFMPYQLQQMQQQQQQQRQKNAGPALQ
jgi:hypothetical protein